MYTYIHSRNSIQKLLNDGFHQKTAVISFFDPENGFHDDNYKKVDYSSATDRVFYVCAWDIDLTELQEFGLDYGSFLPQADDLAQFIYQAKADDFDIICQCEYGESRSAGCAAAIRQHFYKDGIEIFADYRYCPNRLVYHKVLEALERYSFKIAV